MAESKPNWLSRGLLNVASRVEAFINPEQRGQTVSFSQWREFSNWMLNESTDNDADVSVTSTSGTKISTVWNCLNVLAQDIASLPFQVRKETSEGRELVKDSVHRLINKRPNRMENAWQFWYGMVFMGEGWGNSYAYIVRDGSGKPTELIRLKPWEVTTQIVEGELFYVVGGVNAIHNKDMFHYRSFVLDGIEGISKITYNANLMGLKQKQNKFAARSTGNKPPGYLYSPDANQQQRTDAKTAWESNIKGDNIAGTAVLWGTWEYKPLMISPQAAEIVQLTEWSDVNTYGCFRIQPVMVSNHKDSNYSNAEQQNIHHAKFTLAPIITNLEQEANEKLFSERNKTSNEPYYCKFNMKNILRGDMAAFASYVNTMTVLGHVNSDEVREWDDLPPQKDADGNTGIGKKYYQQGAMMEKGLEEIQPQQTSARMINELDELIKGYKLNGHKVMEQ